MRVWIPILLLAACSNDFSVTELEDELAVTPRLSDLGAIAVDTERTFELQLDNLGTGEIRVRAIDVLNLDGDGFSLLSEPPTLAGGDTAKVALRYAPDAPGFHRARVTVTSDAFDSSIEVDVRAQAVEVALQAWPHVLDFGAVALGKRRTLTLSVYNPSQVDLSLTGAALGDAAFAVDATLPLALDGGDTVDVPIRFTPTNTSRLVVDGSLDAEGLPVGVLLRAWDCETGTPSAYDVDVDRWTVCAGDCDDADDTVFPGAIEVADGVDQDCNGLIDDGTSAYDDDGDGASEDDGDCHDGDPAIGPHATEIAANGIDDDCDGVVDSGSVDADGDGFSEDGGDCDDADASVHPGAAETADGADEDCDGTVDEGTTAYDDDGDGQTEAAGDCDDADADTWLGASEQPDWIDNDCDGTVDEGTTNYDDDGDGYSERGGDCDDTDASISPAQLEATGDGVDNDCDGTAS